MFCEILILTIQNCECNDNFNFILSERCSEQCSPVMCDMYCEHGFGEIAGCPVCKCSKLVVTIESSVWQAFADP